MNIVLTLAIPNCEANPVSAYTRLVPSGRVEPVGVGHCPPLAGGADVRVVLAIGLAKADARALSVPSQTAPPGRRARLPAMSIDEVAPSGNELAAVVRQRNLPQAIHPWDGRATRRATNRITDRLTSQFPDLRLGSATYEMRFSC